MNSLALLLLCLVPASLACFASGICGGGCAPPPPPVCSGGCGAGYGCGQYGCYQMRARARSAKTLSFVPGSESKARTPDEKFMECCQERNLPDSCLSKCSYRTYTKAGLQAMYFKQDSCPMQAAADIQYCAAQGHDHRDCCMRNGVATTLSGAKCLTFCDQRPGNITQLDLTYLPCYERFENMKACFWQHASTKVSFSEDEATATVELPQQRRLSSSRTFHAKTFN